MTKVIHYDKASDKVDATVEPGNVEHVQKEQDHLVRVYCETDWYIEFTNDEIERICSVYLD